MNSAMDLKTTYNQIAEDWHQDHFQDNWWAGGVDRFVKLVGVGGLVLDVGCGAGLLSKYLVAKGLSIIGIDFSESMIKIARQEVPAWTFSVMDLNDVGALNYIFDGIFAQAVLLHIPKREVGKKLAELVKKLKDGGYCYAAVKEKRADGPEEEVRREEDYGYPYERFFSYFTLGEMQGYMKNVGLEIVYENVASHGSTRWIQIIGKKV